MSLLEFSLDTIWRRYKYDLAGQLGNLAMRATSLKINPSGRVPDALASNPTPEEIEIMQSCRQLRGLYL
jgi:methionyl-tRNA synthetase